MVLRMTEKRIISSIDDLVAAMGGTGDAAKWAGTTDSCVSNWLARGYLPSGYHLRALLWLHANGHQAKASLFDMSDDELTKLLAIPLDAAVSSVLAA
jgi:hypothetical protein